MTFREATGADLEVLLGFMQAYYAFDHLPFDAGAARASLGQLLQDPSLGRVWLICDGEAPVGYVVLTLGFSLEYHGRDAIVDELFVQERHRGRGIGRQALAFLEEVCRSLGVRSLHLVVERANTGAQAVYRKAGFVDQDRYLMTRRIGSG
jgi:GNAT superfamily N-acetyltransferase